VSLPFLQRGIGVLVEKPLARDAREAQAMIDAARVSGAVFGVGHTERYNPAVAAVRPLLDHPDDQMSTLRRVITDRADLTTPSVVKIVIDAEGYALYFTRAPIPFTRPGSPQPTLWKHLGLYAYRREFLMHLAALAPTPLEMSEGLEQLRALEHGFKIRTAETTVDTIGVDTPEDLERVRRLVGAPARS